MKKLKYILLLFLVLPISSFSVDFSGEVNAERESANNSETEYSTNGKLIIEYEEDNMFTEFSVSADTSAEDNELSIYRAYTELYKDNLSLTLGRQKIVWGSAYLFNMSDVVNSPDPSDPRGDRQGVDSVKFKYSSDDMSRVEVVAFDNSYDGENFAARYTFLLNNYEIMLNYFDYKTSMFNKTSDIKTTVLEFKGDAIVGLWSQLVLQQLDDDNYNYLVLGTDYSFEINEQTLYVVGEGIYNDETKGGLLYLRYNYTLSEDKSFGQSYVGNPEQNAGILYNNFEYLFNDYVTIGVALNYYYNIEDFSGLAGLSFEEDLKHEIKFKISSYF